MHLQIMRTTFASWVLLTTIAHKQYVQFPEFIYPYFIFSQGELEHKRPKGFFPRTSKKGYTVQVAKHVHRQHQLRRKQEMEALLNSNPKPAKKRRKITYADHGRDSTLKVSFYESEPLPPSSLQDKYHISTDQRLYVDLTNLLTSNHDDPAFAVNFPLFSLC